MHHDQIHRLIQDLEATEVELQETHISWILLVGPYAYKIKKPVRYTFLDFTSLAQRRYFCLREVELNRRLTSDIYLGVVEIRQSETAIHLDSRNGTLIDYAVKMKRLDGNRQMHLLLQEGAVTGRHMEQIADQLSTFHQHADLMPMPPNVPEMVKDFKFGNSFILKKLS